MVCRAQSELLLFSPRHTYRVRVLIRAPQRIDVRHALVLVAQLDESSLEVFGILVFRIRKIECELVCLKLIPSGYCVDDKVDDGVQRLHDARSKREANQDRAFCDETEGSVLCDPMSE